MAGTANAQYQGILNDLNRDVARQQPTDVVQFCADWFQDKLRDARKHTAPESRSRTPAQVEQAPDEKSPFDSGAGSNWSNAAPAAAAGGAAGAAAGAAGAGLFSSPFGGGGGGDAADKSNSAPNRGADASPFSEEAPHAGGHFNQSPFGPSAQTPSAPVGVPRASEPTDEEDDDDEAPPVPQYALGRRTSVSAESLVPSHARPFDPSANAFIAEEDEEDESSANAMPTFPKTPEQLARIRKAIKPNFLFRNLDEEQEHDVLSAMREVNIPAQEMIIEQGAAGDYFYVVEKGELEVFVKKDGDVLDPASGDNSNLGKKVLTYHEGASFGELALMHNAPRAASIVSTTPCTLWALDRVSFRTILLDHTSRKRRQYEAFLAAVPILHSLKPAERAKIADVLETRTFDVGQDVIRHGDMGDEFFLIESGSAHAIKPIDGKETIVKTMKQGDYFGELALLNRQARAATVRAAEKLRVVALGEQAFTRLLGPVKDIMARSAGERYGWQSNTGL